MAKMTQARVNRWKSDLQKAQQLVQRTAADIGSAKITTKSSIYSAVMDAGVQIVPVLNGLEALVSDDPRRSPVTRAQFVVAADAQQRKDAKASKDAEKAAASA